MDWNKMGAIGSLGSFLTGLVLIGVQVWPWPQIKAAKYGAAVLPVSGISAILIFMVVGFVLAGLSLYGSSGANRKYQASPIQFFQNRVVLERTRSVIGEELQSHGETFWVMWQAGHLMAHIPPEVRGKVHRMILGNPRATTEITGVRLKVEENQLVDVFGEIGFHIDGLKGA